MATSIEIVLCKVLYIHTYADIYTHIYIFMHTYIWNTNERYLETCTRVLSILCIHICTYTYVHTCTYVYESTHIYEIPWMGHPRWKKPWNVCPCSFHWNSPSPEWRHTCIQIHQCYNVSSSTIQGINESCLDKTPKNGLITLWPSTNG